jgi:hypothetical protein
LPLQPKGEGRIHSLNGPKWVKVLIKSGIQVNPCRGKRGVFEGFEIFNTTPKQITSLKLNKHRFRHMLFNTTPKHANILNPSKTGINYVV